MPRCRRPSAPRRWRGSPAWSYPTTRDRRSPRRGPLGYPPTPSAMSSVIEPVGITGTSFTSGAVHAHDRAFAEVLFYFFHHRVQHFELIRIYLYFFCHCLCLLFFFFYLFCCLILSRAFRLSGRLSARESRGSGNRRVGRPGTVGIRTQLSAEVLPTLIATGRPPCSCRVWNHRHGGGAAFSRTCIACRNSAGARSGFTSSRSHWRLSGSGL